MTYEVTEKGYYGTFGGSYVPETLISNIEELQKNYLKIIDSAAFKKEFMWLLKHYTGRPTPLYYAQRLSEMFGTKILLKREDLCHTGSHKINNTIGQALLAKILGKEHIIAETGAGSHGVATATVCALLGISCSIFMGEKDIERQQSNVKRMQMLGATVIPAKSGSKTLKDATNEALRYWINNPEDVYYLIGSVFGPHPYPAMVTKFQSVISSEILNQLYQVAGRTIPDYVIACIGGGSNAAGSFYHFLDLPEVKLIGAEAAGHGVDSGMSAATTYLGRPGVIHGCKTLFIQSDDGQIAEAHSISAGLDYPGIGPLHSRLHEMKRAEYIPVTDDEAMKAGRLLASKEGIIPALESAHALAILDKKKFGRDEVIVICLSGRGDKDLSTYENYN